ncbi:WD40 repeat domain-containing protein [Kitasatospora sp. MAP5-34]|uniref:WD40 repeat domain-containing protein n=1 Tax=Kitasatospora sp. MAP5-34 TaxID=3035102 RepID=UPI002473B007|nr:WD40 repeat domain-containing protein [Kitasatospora sp. MAP5-34]MDH6580743.1 WD40 repeat protein [Kitasatospora sp. MAP5-34]
MADALWDDDPSAAPDAVPGGLTDPGWLVRADPGSVLALPWNMSEPEEQRLAMVYRASLDVHRQLTDAERRFVLALDAARLEQVDLAAQFAAVAVPGADPLGWEPAWVSGSQADSRLVRTLTGHQGQVTAVATAVVAGRALAVTGGRDGTVRVWDLAAGREACPPLPCRTDARSALSAEVDRIATATLDGSEVALLRSKLAGEQRLLVLDLATGFVTGECVRVVAVAELAGRSMVLTLEDDRTLRLWNAATGAELGLSVPAQLLAGPDGYPAEVRVELGGAVRTWDLVGNELDSAPVDAAQQMFDSQAVAVVVDGRLVACAFDHPHGGDTVVTLIGDLAAACGHRSGAPVRVSQSVAVAGRPAALLREYGGSLRVWDRVAGSRPGAQGWVVTTDELRGQPLQLPAEDPGEDYWFWQLADPAPALAVDAGRAAGSVLGTFVVDGRALELTTDADHAVRVWDAATGAEVGERPFPCHEDRIRAGALAEVNGQLRAVTAGLDRSVRLWEVACGRQVNGPLKGHTGHVWDVATAIVDGHPVAVTAGADHTVRVWGLGERRVLRRTGIRGHKDVVLAAAMTTVQGRPAVVTAGADKTLRTWDLATGIPYGGGIAAEVSLLATAELDGRTVAVTVAPDATLRRWDLGTGQELGQPVAGPAGRVLALATAGVDGRAVAMTGSSDGTAQLWELATGQHLGRPLTGHTGRLTALATATVDGRALAVTGSWDKTVRLWDLATGRQLGEPLTGHADWVTSVITTTLNGHPIAVTAGRDGTIRTWSLPDGRPCAEPLPCPAGPVRGLATAVLGTSTHLITTNGTETVSVRDLATGAELVPPLRCPAPVQSALAAPDGALVLCFGPEIAVLSAVDGQASGRAAASGYDSARVAARPGP